MQDPVIAFVACLVSVCAVGAIALLAFSSRRPAMPALRRVPRVESSLVDWLGRMREDDATKRKPLPIRIIAHDRMITPSGDLILRGDKFAIFDNDGPVPGTTQEVIGFDLPAVLLRPLGPPVPGVRPARIHPDELLSRWVRMDDLDDEEYGRSSECALTQVLPPPPSPDGEACASCGARRFRRSATTGQVECSVCGTVFGA